MDEKYMRLALEEARKSYESDDVPVGAVMVYHDQVIAKTHNLKHTNQIATHHAEILAISSACKQLNNWHLDECTLYVTMEPCLMCAGAILQSRIKRLVYATTNPKFGYVDSIDHVLNRSENNHEVEVVSGVCKTEAAELLKDFFLEKRN